MQHHTDPFDEILPEELLHQLIDLDITADQAREEAAGYEYNFVPPAKHETRRAPAALPGRAHCGRCGGRHGRPDPGKCSSLGGAVMGWQKEPGWCQFWCHLCASAAESARPFFGVTHS